MLASAFFNGLTRQECIEISSCGRARTFARDELLYAQGGDAGKLIFLQSGTVKHTQVSSTGNEVLLWMSGAGEPVNVPTGGGSCGHSCSARAMEKCTAMVWDYSRLQALLDQYPQIRTNINRILEGRLTELQERFREMATENVRKRLALVLLRLLKQVGTVSHEGTVVFLSREELGQMAGTTLFTISRVLSKWAEEGVVVSRREAVLVSDLERLELIGNEEA
jgi:CRP-like cAMP-binding protein